MKVSNTRPTTFSHSAMLLYVAKLSEYAQDVAGQGKQHVGCPGSRAMGAQNRPEMTIACQSQSGVKCERVSRLTSSVLTEQSLVQERRRASALEGRHRRISHDVCKKCGELVIIGDSS
jgi:hypothetical protein